MKVSTAIIVTLPIFLCGITGCDPNTQQVARTSDEIDNTESLGKDISYRDALESGLTRALASSGLPLGEIRIAVGVAAQDAKVDYAKRYFPPQFLEFLHFYKNLGIIDYIEKETDWVYGRKFLVEKAPEAAKYMDSRSSTADLLVIPLGTCSIISIVKESDYKHPFLPQSDDFRLVVGTARRLPNDFNRKHDPNAQAQDIKFRALMKFNPFNNTYSLQAVDYGNISDDGWATQNVP